MLNFNNSVTDLFIDLSSNKNKFLIGKHLKKYSYHDKKLKCYTAVLHCINILVSMMVTLTV